MHLRRRRNRGWKPQSEEHLRILSLLGIRHGIVALTKVGHVDDELYDRPDGDRRPDPGTFLADAPIVPVDAIEGHGIDDLNTALDQLLDVTPTARDDSPLDRPRVRGQGAGTVVAATLTGGMMRVEDGLSVLPQRRGRVGRKSVRRPREGRPRQPRRCQPLRRLRPAPAVTCSCGLTTGMSPARSTPVCECSNRSTDQ